VASWALFRVPYRHVLRSGASGGSDPNAGSALTVGPHRAIGGRRYERLAVALLRSSFGSRVRRSRPPGPPGGGDARAVVRSECEAAWHRRCGGPDQGDLSSLARRARQLTDPAVLTPASGAPVSKGAAGCVPRPWTRSRSLRGLPRIAGGHRAFSRAGYMGHLLVGTPGYQGRSRKGFGLRDDWTPHR